MLGPSTGDAWVRGEVGWVQTVPELLVRPHREEPEDRVGRPVEANVFVPSTDIGPEEPLVSDQPFHGIARALQGLCIRLGRSGNARGDVVEELAVVGVAKAGLAAVDDRTASDV